MKKMSDELNSNLSYILNEGTIETEKKEKSNAKYFFYSIFLILLIYISIIFFDEIKTFLHKLVGNDTKKETQIYKTKEAEQRAYFKHQNKKTEVKIVEKIVKIEPTKKDLINMFNTENFKAFTCKNYPINKFQLNNKCKGELKMFLSENKNAFRFEVVSYLGKRDVNSYLKYKSYLEEILMAGISTKRANEMAWHIKQELSENAIITSKDYYIKSDERTSSVMVKAYH